MMTLGSLFDGIGGFPLAAVHCGGVPVWASEIEPFPHEGNQTPVSRYDPCRGHYKTGWSKIAACGYYLRRQPCQDLSVAGKKEKGCRENGQDYLWNRCGS